MNDATQAVNNEVETTTQTPEVTEETVGSTLESETKKVPDEIPYERFKKVNDKVKSLERELEELKSKPHQSTAEVDADLQGIANEYNLDPEALSKIASAIKKEVSADAAEKLRPITEREELARKESIFQQHFARALENMPEYKGVVNPEVIKQLAFNPANSNKTYSQLIQDAYGNVVKGRDTVETTVARGGNTNGELDMKRAKNDPTYFKEVMSNPALKEKYNEGILAEASRY